MKNLRFPMFVDLSGKRAVVIGGGKIGMRRARVLRDFGAQVTVIDPAPGGEGFYRIYRGYEPGDLEEAFLCVAATNDRAVNHAVYEEAERLRIPISVADNQEECGFFFPAVCIAENLVAGVVSDGEDHHKTARAAREIRRVLEDLS
ncbi:MAG: bifunctional precorrin-2 dehydrogenase/sirohydrochlorin ferrochelatase [Oscillospiraceae bacterium]